MLTLIHCFIFLDLAISSVGDLTEASPENTFHPLPSLSEEEILDPVANIQQGNTAVICWYSYSYIPVFFLVSLFRFKKPRALNLNY